MELGEVLWFEEGSGRRARSAGPSPCGSSSGAGAGAGRRRVGGDEWAAGSCRCAWVGGAGTSPHRGCSDGACAPREALDPRPGLRATGAVLLLPGGQPLLGSRLLGGVRCLEQVLRALGSGSPGPVLTVNTSAATAWGGGGLFCAFSGGAALLTRASSPDTRGQGGPLAQFRQRRAQLDGQNPHKKPKKKKTSSSKNDVHGLNIDQSKSEEMFINSSQGVGSAVMPESTIMRTLNNEEMLKHEQVFCVDPESEISTTADDCTSEVNDCCKTGKPTNLLMEEEFGVVDSYSEQGAHYNETHLELIENELVGKPEHEPEELNRELEEMRTNYGTEGLHQLQEFEAAVKQRDSIITQLTANLQQARRERDKTVREFLELTEQSQKLQIQFQLLQASETLQNSTHSNTAADLLQAKQQILTHQQQVEEQDHLLEDYQKKKEDFKMQINFLQEKIKVYEMEQDEVEKSNKKELQEKEVIIQALNIRIIEEEKKNLELKDQVTATEKLMRELQEQIASMKLELANSKQKERQCSEEIKQLMGTVEDLQKIHHYTDSQFESDVVQKMVEQEMQKRLEQLRAEMNEMYGQQIVQMKQELIKQHMSQIEELKAQHKEEIESVLKSHNITINEDQIKLMNVAINELNMKLQDANAQKEKLQEELGIISGEKSTLQRQLDDLFEELNFLRDQIQRARMIIAEKESQLNEAHKSLSTVEVLKAEIVLASESRKELELKHEAEVTDYKIKLEMLEKGKNAALDRMAESQEAELERLRTQLLFSHEEELSKLKDDLEVEHRINIEKLKDSLAIHYKQKIDGLQNEMSQKMETMQFEKDNLITKQNQLVLEISKLKDLQKSIMDSKSEEMTLQMHELQKEIEILRQEKKEKGTLEQEVQELQLKIELLEKQIKKKEDDLKEKFSQLEAENNILKNEKKAFEDMLKIYVPAEQEEKLIFIDSSKSISKDCSWQKEMEMLTKENEALKQQCIQLNEETEKQRSTFSFAEKNFEANYQELQEEYTCLLKVKDDLEDSKNKQELEYKSKLKALNGELHLQRINPATIKVKSAMLDTNKAFVPEPLEICEVVEKDTTELMEKLEVTKREKLELSEKLSDLSEQLKQKHGEVNFLSEEVKSLKQEKEKILLRFQELELLINHHRAENINMCDVHLSSLQDGIVTIINKDSQGSLSNVGEDFGEESKTVVEEKISFENVAIRRESKQEQLFSPSVTNESSPGTDQSSENDKLHQELYVLKSEQNDLRLQMEAQCICLSLVYSAHVDQVCEYMENEKDKALCNIKEELISAQEEKIKELQKIYQLELQNVKTQEIDTKKIKQLEEQIQELENFICFLRKQLKETEENHRAEIYSLQEKLQAISEATVDPRMLIHKPLLEYAGPLSQLRKQLEQAIDREHERDVFQQEIQKLEQQLKVVPRIQPVGEHQTREVEQLTKDLKEKTDKCSELFLSKEQLQRDVQERNEEIEKLEFRVRELEQALLVSTDNFQKVEDQKQFGALEAKAELSLEVQLQAERDAIDRKEKEITNLEEQVEQFRDELENKNEEVQQLHIQLEIQKKESTTCLQELEQENKLFKDEMEKLRFAIMDPEAVSTHDQHMLFGKFAQIIQEKEVKIDRLNDQIRDFHQQLRLTTDNKDFKKKNELIRDLEAQIECLKSDQERLKKNREEETDKLNEVIEKLQEELSYIKQNMLLDTNSPSEQEDSLKHQLEKVIAEKLALEQQVEITKEEMAFTKNVLKETNFKMDQLTQELVNLKREHDHKEKIQRIPDESVSMTIDDLSKDQPELEVIHIEDVLKPPENNMYLRSFEESTEVSRNLETKLLQLESSVSTKDLELIQCYKQIEDIKEQGQSETEMLQKKIVNLQKVLEEKVAAALVSQVQLEAVQEYVKFYEDKGIASSELEKENMQNLNQITENKMESDMSALTLRISDLERQVIEMHTTLISEKEQVETAEKNALEKEKKLIELQKLLEDSKKKLEGKERKRSPHGDFLLKTTTEINASGESRFFEELEALRIELVATKEELATFKESTEKLQKELLVKETNMASLQRDLSQVKNQLVEEKKKLSHFLIKEDKSEVPTNRNICLEPLPIVVGKNTASQTDQILKVNMSNQTPQILVKNAGIQIDIQTSCSSEKVSEIIRQFTERIEHIQELHATEILDMESRHISETETLKKEHYVAVELLTEECGTLKAVIQCLRPKEGSLIPELMYSNAYKTREIYSSDSGSDWSQGVYLTQNQGFDTASEGRGEEGENITESFPKKIKGLLRAVHNEGLQVLSLTESPCGEREDHSIQQVSEFWLEERRSYLNIISSLKDLITKIQVQRESEVNDNSQSHESLPDWGEFLLALQHVFLKEHNVLLAAFQIELTALGTKDAVGLLKCLEQIQEQV
ncbi:LOW QUALITY PROTEIN: A-kinase anchor protein 9-like [Callospermophilus lateralis]